MEQVSEYIRGDSEKSKGVINTEGHQTENGQKPGG